jgi:uncharacterized protein YjbI with pentapeptide repeats
MNTTYRNLTTILSLLLWVIISTTALAGFVPSAVALEYNKEILVGSDFSERDLTDSSFTKANLRYSNFTNANPNHRDFVAKFGKKGNFLFSPFSVTICLL